MLLKKSELKGKKILIFGLNGTGKTYLAKYIAKKFNRVFVITMNDYEWKDTDVVVGRCKTIDDYRFWLTIFNAKALYKQFELLIIDDFDVVFKSNFDKIKAFSNLMFRNRHLNNLTIIAVTRRPQNLPTVYYEIFDILCGFSIESTNVVDKLNKIYNGFGDMIKQIPYGSHKFVFKRLGETPKVLKV